MSKNQRQYSRFDPHGLIASVILEHESEDQVLVSGEVIDMSYSGIRLKLAAPLHVEINDKIKIQLVLPESGIPYTIRGVIKHELIDNQYGLVFVSPPSKNEYEDLVLECFKLA